MKPTFKAIARAAGYYAWCYTSAPEAPLWDWQDQKWSRERCKLSFYTEEAAYYDCCIQCGLVEPE